MARSRTDLKTWHWRLANANGSGEAFRHSEKLKQWQAAAFSPSVVQMELLEKKLIPNPDIGENERAIQWVGESDWEYRSEFPTPESVDKEEHVELCFDGLDTFATATLNGKTILKSDNMFLPARAPVKDLLRPVGHQNTLVILFESAAKVGTQLEEKYGPRTSWMRDRRRMHIRKAQYSWGWDWGPIMLTAGPWQPVYLEAYSSRIASVYIRTYLSPDHTSAGVDINVSSVGPIAGSSADIVIAGPDGVAIAASRVGFQGADISTLVSVKNPQLWWPAGQGTQLLYTATIKLVDANGSVVDTSTTRFGIRTIEIIQRPLDSVPGKTFMFRVNGRDIFIQGGDWIPADTMLPRITRQRYHDWVALAKYGNLNMIRVWGGGIYESDDFWDACDEQGILVWHDYAFACGDYPMRDDWMDSIEKEAKAQTLRMRNRASLAILCGGNEDFMFTDWNKDISYDFSDLTPPFDDKPFPQRKIYLDILVRVASHLCPSTYYHANSPWGAGGKEANDATVGDIHQWGVWHEGVPYQDYKKLSGRFVSEFGMHGFPVQRTVDYFTRGASSAQRHPQSKLIDCHNKGTGAHTRIARYLAENFRFDMTKLENFVYSSQLMQSEAYGYALRDWKRLFNGPGDEQCAGLIIWQLNDVYPSTSWAFVDYFLRPKPAFYMIKRAFASLSVAVERTPNTRWIDEDKPRDSEVPKWDIFAHNTTNADVQARLLLKAYEFDAQKWTDLGVDAERDVVLKAGRNTELGALKQHQSWSENSLVVLEASLVDTSSSETLTRFVDWPEPYRYLAWPSDTSLVIEVQPLASLTASSPHTRFFDNSDWEAGVTVCSEHPLKGVWLEPVYNGTENDADYEPLWEDNMLDLMPGEQITVKVKGLKGRKVKARFLCDWETDGFDTA